MRLKDIFHTSFKALAMAAMAFASLHQACAAESSVALADTLYARGEYSKAAEAYLAVSQVDGNSPELLFNLANSYAQAGDLGRAVLYYSRAGRLDPTNKEVRNNLDYFTSKVEDSNRAELRGRKISVAPDHQTFFQSVNRFICTDFSRDMWAWVGVVAVYFFMGKICNNILCSGVRMGQLGFLGGNC